MKPPHVRVRRAPRFPPHPQAPQNDCKKISIAKQNGRLKPSVLFCRNLSRPLCKRWYQLRFGGVRKAIEVRKRSAAAVHPDAFRVPSRSAFRAVSQNAVPIGSVPSTVQAFQKFTAFQKAQVCKETQAFLTISRLHPSRNDIDPRMALTNSTPNQGIAFREQRARRL